MSTNDPSIHQPDPNQNLIPDPVDESSPGTSPHKIWPWGLALIVLGVAGYLLYPIIFRSTDKTSAAGISDAPATSATQPASGKGVIPVIAATAIRSDLPIYLTGLGSVAPFNSVTVRTRVDGQLDNILFTEGQTVQKGDLLAQIDSRPFEAQLAQAQGQLTRDQSLMANAKLDLGRYSQAEGAVSEQQLATQRALVGQSEATLAVDQAVIDGIKLQLTYCKITSPIAGRVGFRHVDQGNMVHANDPNGLLVITQLQPIALFFSLPEDNIPQIVKRIDQGQDLIVEAYNRDLKTKIATGKLATLDNQIDPSTGTLRIKAVFDNTDKSLFPSQFVNARLLVNTLKDVVLVPAAAIQRSPDQSAFVYVVGDDHAVVMRTVTIGPTEADMTVVRTGLTEDQVVVTDGVDKLTPGTKVTVKLAPLHTISSAISGPLGNVTTHDSDNPDAPTAGHKGSHSGSHSAPNGNSNP